MNSMSRRWWMYLFLLIFSIAASIWVTVRGPRSVSAATPIAPPREKRTAAPTTRVAPSLQILVREFPEQALTGQYRNPFSVPMQKASAAAPPPPQAALRDLPPSPATAPPLPFTYRGVILDGEGAWIVQLARGNEFILMGRGETIDATYRLDDFNSDELYFNYLPLSIVQTLSTASSQQPE